MSTIETGEFKERLLEERRRLQEAVDNLRGEHPGSLEDETQELSLADNHPGDVATETYDRELDEGLEEGAERQLEQIDAALGRVDDGTYGLRPPDGKPIPAARLRAVPWATLRVDHQSEKHR